MPYTIKKTEVWAGDILNRPGMLARVLESLTAAGAQLEFIIARRASEKTSRVFVSPLKGKKQQNAARDVGLLPAVGINALRIEGPDRQGLGAEISRCVAAADINLRGVSVAIIGRKAIFYLAFKTEGEAKAAAKAIRKLLSAKKR